VSTRCPDSSGPCSPIPRAFTKISALLTQDAILKLNAAVELDGLPADKVALEFLKTNGIV